MSFQDGIPSIPIEIFKDHYVLVFDLISLQDAIETCQYSEQAGEPLRLELNFTFPLEHFTELNVLGERMPLVAVDKFGVVGKISEVDNNSLLQTVNRIPQLNYRYRGSFPSDYVPTLHNDVFATINTQPSNLRADLSIMVANSCHKLYFVDSLGQPSFLKQQYKQMMPEPL